MKRVILDECLPRRLGRLLPGHEVVTVPQAGFSGLTNGKLIAAMRGRFDVFVTIDGNLQYQQNLTGLDFGVVVIHALSNRFPDLEPFGEALRKAVDLAVAGTVTRVPSA